MSRCPNGHESETDDWCDTCGVAMDGAPSVGATTAAPEAESGAADPSTAGEPESAGEPQPDVCPNCGTPRVDGDVFCEVCGLDHATGKLPKTPSAPTPVESADPAPAAGKPSGWIVVVETDRDFFATQEADGVDLEFPDGIKAREVTLLDAVATIGRRSDRDGWYPTIDLGHPLDDPAVSRKHAELRPTDDGWQVVDVGSTNGTVVAGETIAADSPVDLADGDHVNLGVFTRLTLKKSSS